MVNDQDSEKNHGTSKIEIQAHELISPYAYDPEFLPLVVNFLSGLEQEFSQLQSEIRLSHHHDVATRCHRLRGTAATYGYPSMATLLGQIEYQALRHEGAWIEASLNIFESIINLARRFNEALKSLHSN